MDEKSNQRQFGLSLVNDKIGMGWVRDVKITDTDIVLNGKEYPLTMGLVQLLCSRKPGLYKQSDLDAYKQILTESGVHLTRNNTLKKIGHKYRDIISPMFHDGSGLELRLNPNSAAAADTAVSKEYLYWDNPNELVDRLRLLMAARSAGNTGVSPEVVAILEELTEAGYIDGIPQSLKTTV